MYPKVSIVTPNFNLANFLEETIISVIGQGYPNLEYIIIDGGSSDHSIDIIKKYEEHLSYWVSEPDQGMYDALNKGFKKATGEIMLWINSDDFLFPRSLFSIAKVFGELPDVDWIHGLKVFAQEDGTPVNIREQRNFSRYSLFMNDYKWIQQESVAWRQKLYHAAGNKMETSLKYAGDFELWTRFLCTQSPYNVPFLVGGFRGRKGQLSKVGNDSLFSLYESEVSEILKKLDAPINLKKVILRNKLYMQLINWLPPRITRSLKRKHFEMLGYVPEIVLKNGKYQLRPLNYL